MDAANAGLEAQLKDINQQLYERNVELAIRNRTLSALRKMYEIINSSLGVGETAQKLIEAIVVELQFKEGFIAIVNESAHLLQVIASSSPSSEDKIVNLIGQPLSNLNIPLESSDNYCVKSLNLRQRMMTNFFSDILTPLVEDKKAEKLQDALGVKTSFIFPLTSAIETAGVLVLGMDKHVGDLSRAERETLKELIDVVAIAIDRATLLENLHVANEKLKELDKKKDEFVSIASHELRTPMTAIRSYLWLALAGKGGTITDKQKYYLERSYDSTVRLIKLVNDMLNVSRIESGRITLEMIKMDMGSFIADVIAEVKPRADELGITIENKYDPASPLPAVLADSNKIKEVLINLIGNSLKFTARGGKITLWFESQNGMVITHVTDTGGGIDPENIPKLFQKFALIGSSYVTNQMTPQGTGLGLYISKSIVELHGGKIWAESAGHGQGATFSFTLKVYREEELEKFQKLEEGRAGVGLVPNVI